MEQAAQVISSIFKDILPTIKKGDSLLDIDSRIAKSITKHKATSINKGYIQAHTQAPYPNVSCLSVNNIVAHGIPTTYKLKAGDILNIDMGIIYKDWCADAATMVAISPISEKDKKLLNAAKQVMMVGIQNIKPGVPPYELGYKMEKMAKELGYKTNKMFVSHGIGKTMHEQVVIPNYRRYDRDWIMQFSKPLLVGQIVCIEPQLTRHSDMAIIDKDGWTGRSDNGANSAYYEHMVEVTEKGYKILTSHI